MNPTNKKIVGGVLALLFIVSIVQTQAILKVAKTANRNNGMATAPFENQEASGGLASSLASNNCITVTKNWGLIMMWENSPNNHTFDLNVLIKNNCSEKVYILGPESFNSYGGNYPVGYTSPFVSLKTGWTTLYNNPFVANTVSPSNYQVISDWTAPSVSWFPADADVGAASNSLYSPAQIMPGETKNVEFVFTVQSAYSTLGETMLSLDRVKFFKQSALDGDYLVKLNEIKTKTVTNITTDMIYALPPTTDQVQNNTSIKSVKEYIDSARKMATPVR